MKIEARAPGLVPTLKKIQRAVLRLCKRHGGCGGLIRPHGNRPRPNVPVLSISWVCGRCSSHMTTTHDHPEFPSSPSVFDARLKAEIERGS